MKTNFDVDNILPADIPKILKLCGKIFGEAQGSEKEVKVFLKETTNFSLSKKATIDGNIVGCYLLNEDSVYNFLQNSSCVLIDISKYKDLKGLQGLALAVLPTFRNLNIGKTLRETIFQMKGYDYIWGQHLKGLHNVDHWIKFGRHLVADGIIDGEDMWVTLMDLHN